MLFRSPPSVDTQNHQRIKSTTLASTTSQTTGRGSADERKNNETHPMFVGTAAYTRYGVEKTFDPQPRSSTYKHPTYPNAIDHHDLQNESAHTITESSMQHQPRTPRMEEALECPYHGPILQGHSTDARSDQGLGPMDRYVAEGPSERYAVLHRSDTRSLSTHNGCRCLELTQSSADARGHARN